MATPIDHVTVSLEHWNRLQAELKLLKEQMDTRGVLFIERSYGSTVAYHVKNADEATSALVDKIGVLQKYAESLNQNISSNDTMERDLNRKITNIMNRDLYDRIINKKVTS